ncbi:hypothetical protein ABMA28_006124 [Loxostege sticticalis]|uniref:Uncharacterized protein n=1 Tax=Loxostege sticticalis TaxID=481309 RepID=A0ABD0SK36_LOXSC
MYRDELHAELVSYRKELDKPSMLRTEFLEAMNSLFTLKEKLQFNDYLFDLRDYGNEDIIRIDEETKKLLNMIVESVDKLSKNDRKELERKLRKAIKDYKTRN